MAVDTPQEPSIPAEAEGRRARKARVTRQALMKAGLAAFQRQPPSLVSVLDITEAADVAKGVFYLHFASKDDFLLALWEEVQGAFLAEIRKAVADCDVVERGITRQRVVAAIAQYGRSAAANPAGVCFALRMSGYVGDEIGKPGELAERRNAQLARLAAVLEGSDGDGPLQPAAIAIARTMDACCWGLIWQHLQLGQPPPDVEGLVQAVLPAVEHMLSGISSD